MYCPKCSELRKDLALLNQALSLMLDKPKKLRTFNERQEIKACRQEVRLAERTIGRHVEQVHQLTLFDPYSNTGVT